MKNKNSNWLIYVLASIVVICGLGVVIDTAVTGQTKPLITIIWAACTSVWVLMYLAEFTLRKNFEKWYDELDKAYDSLNEEFDKLLITTKEVNDNNIKQNALCDEVNKNNAELLKTSQEYLDMSKRLINEKHDLLVALAEYDPQHPLIVKFMKEVEERQAAKLAQEKEETETKDSGEVLDDSDTN